MSFQNFSLPGRSARENEAASEETERLEAEEREATKRVLNVWSLPGGRRPWVTLLFLAGGVAATAWTWIDADAAYRWLYAGGTEIWLDRKWWGVLGSLFIHGDALHLLFNAYWIWLFGRLLERELRRGSYLGLVAGGALAGGAAELAWSGELGVGLSGVVYSFFGFMIVNGGRHPDFRRVLPGNTRILMFGWLGFCFFLTWSRIMPIANFAHLGGLLIGLLAGLAASAGRWVAWARGGCVGLAVLSVGVLCWAPWQEGWQVAEAYRALVAQDEPRALAALEKVRLKAPGNLWALQQESMLRVRRGEYARARALMQAAVDLKIDAMALNQLAWLLATCPDDKVRDGAAALRLAKDACELDEWRNAAYIDTLAAALAETGDFEQAEKRMQQTMEKDVMFKEIYRSHLDAFRAGKPWREPPAGAAPATSEGK